MADATDYLLHAALGVLTGGEKAYGRHRDIEEAEALEKRKIELSKISPEELPPNIAEEYNITQPIRKEAIPLLTPSFAYDKEGNLIQLSRFRSKVTGTGKEIETPEEKLDKKKELEKYKVDLFEKKAKSLQDIKFQATKPKVRRSLKGTLNGLSEIENKIDRLLSDPKLGSGTGWQSYILRQPSGKVKEIENLVDSIKAGISLDSLTELRANSPTGGALGNVSDAEGQRLENKRAKLDPKAGDKIFKDALLDLKNSINRSKESLKSGYEKDFDESFEEENIPESSNPDITVDDFIKNNPGSKFLGYEQ